MGEATGRFRRSDRLLDSRDYRRVMRRGRRHANGDLVVISAPKREKPRKNGDLSVSGKNGELERQSLAVPSRSDGFSLEDGPRASLDASNRIGITASRKVGGAVVRNRFKRRIREWFRARRHDLGQNQDFVVIARRTGAVMNLSELDCCLSKLLKVDPSPRFQASSESSTATHSLSC